MLAVLSISLRAGLPIPKWSHAPVPDASVCLTAKPVWLVLCLVDLHLADSSDVSHRFLGVPHLRLGTMILIDHSSSTSNPNP